MLPGRPGLVVRRCGVFGGGFAGWGVVDQLGVGDGCGEEGYVATGESASSTALASNNALNLVGVRRCDQTLRRRDAAPRPGAVLHRVLPVREPRPIDVDAKLICTRTDAPVLRPTGGSEPESCSPSEDATGPSSAPHPVLSRRPLVREVSDPVTTARTVSKDTKEHR